MLKNIRVKHGNVNPEHQSVHHHQDHTLVEKQYDDHAGDHEGWLTQLKVMMISMISTMRKPGRWVWVDKALDMIKVIMRMMTLQPGSWWWWENLEGGWVKKTR